MQKKQLIIENITFDELANALVQKLKIKEPKATSEGVLLTHKEAAERLRVSTRTIHNWMKAEVLPCYSVGNRTYIKSTDIEKHLVRKKY